MKACTRGKKNNDEVLPYSDLGGHMPWEKALRCELENLPLKDSSPTAYIMPQMPEIYINKESRLSSMMSDLFSQTNIRETATVNNHSKKRSCKSFHSLRTTFVTKCAEADISLEIVKTIVGHSSITMTNHYTKIREKAIREAFLKAGVS